MYIILIMQIRNGICKHKTWFYNATLIFQSIFNGKLIFNRTGKIKITGFLRNLDKNPSKVQIKKYICTFCDVLPLILIPKEHSHVINDALHAQLDNDASVFAAVVDRVSREAALHVVVLRVTVQQCLLHLTEENARTKLGRSNIAVDN